MATPTPLAPVAAPLSSSRARWLSLALGLLAATGPGAATAAPGVPLATGGEPGTSPSAPGRLQLVGLCLSSRQVLLWDGDSGRYRLHQVGDVLDGARVVAITAGGGAGGDGGGAPARAAVVLERDGQRELLELSDPPRLPVPGEPRRAVPPAPLLAGGSLGALPPLSTATPPPSVPALPPSTPTAAASPGPAAPPTSPGPPAPAVATPAAVPTVAAPLLTPPVAAVVTPQPLPASAEAATAPSLDAAAPPPPTAEAAPAPARPALPPMRRPLPPPTLIRPESRTIVVRKADFDRHLANLDELDDEAAIVASPHGYQLATLRPGGFLESLGLQSGDVVLSIDGRPIRTPDDAARAYAWLRVTDQFVLDLLRAGERVRLRYQITT